MMNVKFLELPTARLAAEGTTQPHAALPGVNESTALVRLWRAFSVASLLLRGMATIVFIYPWLGQQRRIKLRQRWSQDLLQCLGVHLEVHLGDLPPDGQVVANHISWLDVFVINAALPSAFVAKEEVRRWPLVGWLAAKNDTLFLRRGRRTHVHLVNAEIAEQLAAGKRIAVFPEGTTTDGLSVRPFHAALFQPALKAQRPVLPLAISYWEASGERSLAPRYDGDVSFGQCLYRLLACRHLHARLVGLAPQGLAGEDRQQMAHNTRAAICAAIGLPA